MKSKKRTANFGLHDIKNIKLGKFLKQFEEENYFIKWYEAQPVSAKLGFYSAAVFALLTHLVMYSTLILEDHVPGFTRSRVWAGGQRWFHHWINALNFDYLNWVTGLMQVLFLSLSVFIVIKAFNINNKLYVLLIAGLMVTFPAIAETNLYFHDAAPYFFAVLLSIFAFYITKLYKFGWVIGLFFIMLGLAIYQSKISVAMFASLIYLVLYIFESNPKFMDFVKYASRYFLLVVGGLVAYWASFEIFDFTLGNHRGLDRVISLDTLRDLPENIMRVYREVYYYFFSTMHGGVRNFRIPNSFLIFSYRLVFLVGILMLALALRQFAKTYKSVLNVVIVCMLVLLLPLAANFSRLFDTGGISVLVMSSYAFVFFLVLPMVLWENIKINTYGLKKIVCLALVFIIGYYVSFSNFIYLRGEVITMRYMHTFNRVAARIEPLLPYSTDNQVFLMGNLVLNPLQPHMADFVEYTPRTVQNRIFGSNVIGGSENHFVSTNAMRYRIGLNFNHVSGNSRRRYLLDRAITYGVPVWPQEGSVTLVDGVVVGMLDFFGRLDVDETIPNNFTAIANHTGKASNLEFAYVWYLYSGGQRLERIYEDMYGSGHLSFEIYEPGSYQFRVFIALQDGLILLDSFSPTFVVE